MGLIGRKIGMTQIFDDKGKQIPVTAIKVGPCTVLEIKSKDIHGYTAVKLGFEDVKESRLISPERGYFDHLNRVLKEKNIDRTISPKKVVREFRIEEKDLAMAQGEDMTVDWFENIKFVDIVGKTKGKGFQGMVKRHNAGRGRMTHGSKFHRSMGGTAMREQPGRVHPGKRMPGQLGDTKITVQNLEIVKILKDDNILLVKGAVPGAKNNLVLIKKSIKK